MIDIDEVDWPTEALEPPVIGDELAEEGFERRITADDQVPGVMAYGVEYWERGTLDAMRLFGTDIPGAILFLTEPEPVPVPEAPEQLHGDWDTPTPMLPTGEELAARTHPDDVAFLDDLETRINAQPGGLLPALVTLDDVAGIFGPDWTGGMDAVAWVRAQRDDEYVDRLDTFDDDEEYLASNQRMREMNDNE